MWILKEIIERNDSPKTVIYRGKERMKEYPEIRGMYRHCLNKKGLVSPSVLQTLEWILEIGRESDYDILFNFTRDGT